VCEIEDGADGVGAQGRPAFEAVAVELRTRAEALDVLALEALVSRTGAEDELRVVLVDDAAFDMGAADEVDAIGEVIVAGAEGEGEEEERGPDRRETRRESLR